jgi:hypothetical protein
MGVRAGEATEQPQGGVTHLEQGMGVVPKVLRHLQTHTRTHTAVLLGSALWFPQKLCQCAGKSGACLRALWARVSERAYGKQRG